MTGWDFACLWSCFSPAASNASRWAPREIPWVRFMVM